MTYEIVSYSPTLDAQIAELQTHLWRPDPARNAAYLRWKHLENPFLPEPLIQLGVYRGRAVAMRSAFGTLWEVGEAGSCHLLPYADDFVVAPEHRNSGVARQVMQATVDEATRRGFPYAVNLSAGPTTFINSLASGWRRVGSFEPVLKAGATHGLLQRLAAVIRRTPYVGRIADPLRATLLRALRRSTSFAKLGRSATPTSGPISVAADPRPEAMAALIRRLPCDGRMRQVRDERYFAWRFRNPLHEYRFVYWDDEGGLQGYLVLQRTMFPQPSARLNIADWEAGGDEVRASLLDVVMCVSGLSQLRAWRASASTTTKALLQARGFEPPPAGDLTARSEGLLVRRLAHAAPDEAWLLNGRDLRTIESWDLRMLYSMSA